MQVIFVTTPENIEGEPQEMEFLPLDSIRNVFAAGVYRCYMPGSNPPEIVIPETEPEPI